MAQFQSPSRSLIAIYCGLVYFRMFLYLCIIFSRPFAVFLIHLLIMWIPEFLMVYKIRGGGWGGEMIGWELDPGGGEAEGEKSGGKAPGGGWGWTPVGNRLIPVIHPASSRHPNTSPRSTLYLIQTNPFHSFSVDTS